MTGACIAPYPHYSWVGAWRTVGQAGEKVELHMRQVAHCLIYTNRAKAAVRWIRGGREERYRVDAGCVWFSPADNDDHTLVGRCNPWHRFYTLLIPRDQLLCAASAEGITALPELRHSLSARDAVLTSCMRTLSQTPQNDSLPSEEEQEVAGLTLILRLMAINGFRGPDWKSDHSVFSRRVLHDLVAYIDEHLHPAPSLNALALLTGMSPGHFAKKFRHSTGLSLGRFISLRRMRKSLSMLQETSTPLSDVARDLGFSSQSHFTRLFSTLTGMPPGKYRKQFRRTIG